PRRVRARPARVRPRGLAAAADAAPAARARPRALVRRHALRLPRERRDRARPPVAGRRPDDLVAARAAVDGRPGACPASGVNPVSRTVGALLTRGQGYEPRP